MGGHTGTGGRKYASKQSASGRFYQSAKATTAKVNNPSQITATDGTLVTGETAMLEGILRRHAQSSAHQPSRSPSWGCFRGDSYAWDTGRRNRPVSQFFPPTTDVGISQFYLHTHTFIRNRNEPYLSLPSQQQLVLIYRPRRDGSGRLSRPWGRQSLWLPLRSNGIPKKILQLIEDLYNNTFSCVRVDGELYVHGLRPPLEFDRAVLYP